MPVGAVTPDATSAGAAAIDEDGCPVDATIRATLGALSQRGAYIDMQAAAAILFTNRKGALAPVVVISYSYWQTRFSGS